jgi:single-stranded-DNA-specific exonuclease
VIGIVAGRLAEKFHRPIVMIAQDSLQGRPATGSVRSVPGFDVHAALIACRSHLVTCGGHAAAAGVSLRREDVGRFRDAFESVVAGLVTPADLARTVDTDGRLEDADLRLEVADLLAGQVWGQGFPPPLFEDEFEVRDQRIVGGRHLKLRLRRAGGGSELAAMRFGEVGPLPSHIRAAYRIEANEWNGARTLQLMVEHWQAPE